MDCTVYSVAQLLPASRKVKYKNCSRWVQRNRVTKFGNKLVINHTTLAAGLLINSPVIIGRVHAPVVVAAQDR